MDYAVYQRVMMSAMNHSDLVGLYGNSKIKGGMGGYRSPHTALREQRQRVRGNLRGGGDGILHHEFKQINNTHYREIPFYLPSQKSTPHENERYMVHPPKGPSSTLRHHDLPILQCIYQYPVQTLLSQIATHPPPLS